MKHLSPLILLAIFTLGSLAALNNTIVAPTTIEGVGLRLLDMEKRLYSIEDKIDHLLYHNSHDVTPHNIQFTPFGPAMIPTITNPQSAHTQMKTHDILRNGVASPYNVGFGGMYPPPAYGGSMPYSPLF